MEREDAKVDEDHEARSARRTHAPAVAFVIRILRLRYVSLRSAQDAPLTLPHPEKRTLRIGSGCSRKASVIPSIVVTEPLPGQLRGGGEMANASVLKPRVERLCGFESHPPYSLHPKPRIDAGHMRICGPALSELNRPQQETLYE